MKLQPRIFATLCAALISTPAFAAQISLPTTLDQLLPDGDFVVVGNKTFDQFNYSMSGDMPIPEQINVQASTSGEGIRFGAPFADLPGGIGNGISMATIGYTVTSSNPGISHVMLTANPSLVGGGGSGFATVTETYAGFPNVKLDVFQDVGLDPPVVLEASASLGATVNALTVMQGISLFTTDAVIPATLQFTEQVFVPEPTGLMLALAGFVGLGALRRRQ